MYGKATAMRTSFPKAGRGRSGFRDINKSFDCATKAAAEILRNAQAALTLQILKNFTYISLGVGGDDETTHRERRVPSLASSRLKKSSPDETSPRATEARASST